MKRIYLLLLAITTLVGCSLERETALLNEEEVLIRNIEPAGINCAEGGQRFDKMINGEIVDTYYICNGLTGEKGEDGYSYLTRAEKFPVSMDYPSGGTDYYGGLDLNRNNYLDDEEITSHVKIANGLMGPRGADGEDGTDGTDGEDGQDGEDALNIVFDIKEDYPSEGMNTFFIGYDLNDNMYLDDEEIVRSFIVEDGADGTNGTDGINGQDGAQGPQGEQGEPGENGQDGQDGVDGQDGTNGTDGQDGQDGADGQDGTDGQDGEDGQDGVDGMASFIEVHAASYNDCQYGGVVIITGRDYDRDLIFDYATETTHTEYFCNPEPPCQNVSTETPYVIDFQELSHGFYDDNKGVQIWTSGCYNKLKVASETSYNYTFGYSGNNMVGYVAQNSNGNPAVHGGTIRFTFNESVTVESLDFIDSDSKSDNKVVVQHGNTNTEFFIPKGSDKNVYTVNINLEDVTVIEVISAENFAVDNLKFKKITVTNTCD